MGLMGITTAFPWPRRPQLHSGLAGLSFIQASQASASFRARRPQLRSGLVGLSFIQGSWASASFSRNHSIEEGHDRIFSPAVRKLSAKRFPGIRHHKHNKHVWVVLWDNAPQQARVGGAVGQCATTSTCGWCCGTMSHLSARKSHLSGEQILSDCTEWQKLVQSIV